MNSQAEAESWEDLDVDNSELPSFLHPCKRKSQPPKSLSSTPDSNSSPRILRRCSSSRSSETLTPQPPHNPNPPAAETSSSSCLIPGPAGSVQAAMRRKLREDPSSFGDQGDPIPTQEYIRRAVEEPDKGDEDFSRNPWISAIDYIRSEGLLGDDGVSIGTPVSVIKSGFVTWGKVNQVVAIVKTCTPNGLGDLTVTLKDPTGTIDASVHRKAVAENEYGRDIRAGAVVILKKVAVCTPARLSCYLNITVSNISKIITQDTLPSPKQNNPTRSAEDSIPIFENEKCLQTPSKVFYLDQDKTEGIMNSLRWNAHASIETHTDVEMEVDNPAEVSISVKDVAKNQDEHRVEQVLTRNQDSEIAAADRTTPKLPQEKNRNPEMPTQEDVATNIDTNTQVGLLVNEQVMLEKHADRSHQPHYSQPRDVMASHSNNCDKYATNTKVDRTQPQSSSSGEKMQQLPCTSSVPRWTDEQLDELFAFD